MSESGGENKNVNRSKKRNFYALYANLKPNVDISADIWKMIAIYQLDSNGNRRKAKEKRRKAFSLHSFSL